MPWCFDAESEIEAGDQHVRAPTDILFGATSGSCEYCFGCVRACPASAISIAENRTRVVEERCVKCGRCVQECSRGGVTVRDDLPKVRDLLGSERKVVMVLATEYLAALHPRSALEVEQALLNLGFYSVESTLLGEELVAAEYEKTHSRQTGAFLLRSTCPVTVDWIRKFHPGMSKALAPIMPPYIAQAHLVRSMYDEDLAVVYASPCYARKDDIFDPAFGNVVDAAIDFTELECLLAEKSSLAPSKPNGANQGIRPMPAKEISLTDGFPRKTLQEHCRMDENVVTVRGLGELDALLSAMGRGEAAPAIVDMLSCESCIDGPAVNPRLSAFAKRNLIATERQKAGTPGLSTREILKHLPPVDLRRSFMPTPVLERVLPPAQIEEELKRGGFDSIAEVIDCGACGFTKCADHAAAIIRAHSKWERCLPQEKTRQAESIERLQRDSLIDGLTRLWNKRALDVRLAEEVARAVRYGTALSLLMIEIDDFELLGDAEEFPAVESVLKTCADALGDQVRQSDYLARPAGGEFAIILPSTGKTAAFAVAEKLRTSIVAAFQDPQGGGPGECPVTICVGVAALSEGTSQVDGLLMAAKGALLDAKQSGKDRVKLAPG